MSFFNQLGNIFIRLFNLIGTVILRLFKLPSKLRNFNSKDVLERIDTESLKDNISRIKDDIKLDQKISNITSSDNKSDDINESRKDEISVDSNNKVVTSPYSVKEKENTILKLQILSASFLVVSILNIFSFISYTIYIPLGVVIVGYILYLLYNKVKNMYSKDFQAYRDFFLMYVAVGIILVIIGTNSSFVTSFSIPLIPSASILILAVVAVLAVFIIFRIRYYRNFTYGTIVDGGKNTAYVKVEYDIRSNVKPGIYIVENKTNAVEGDYVKLKLEEKFLSMGGNKPISIMENDNNV